MQTTAAVPLPLLLQGKEEAQALHALASGRGEGGAQEGGSGSGGGSGAGRPGRQQSKAPGWR